MNAAEHTESNDGSVVRGLFIAGTDTGVGKTLVAAGLVRLALDRGIRAVAVKPVETGCVVRSGELFPEDGAFLRSAASERLTLDACTPWRFSLPASPFRAAAMEGGKLYLADIVEHVRTVAEDAGFIVVEGAGGLMVPIEHDRFMMDLIVGLGFPTLLVARTRLGTVNHTLLSLEALKSRDVPVAGVVLSCSEPEPGPEEEFTPADLGRLIAPVPLVVQTRLDAEEAKSPERIARRMQESWPESFLRSLLPL